MATYIAATDLRSSGDEVLRPRARTDPLVERVGCKIGTSWPDHGAALEIERDLHKSIGGTRSIEYRPTHPPENIDLTTETVGKR